MWRRCPSRHLKPEAQASGSVPIIDAMPLEDDAVNVTSTKRRPRRDTILDPIGTVDLLGSNAITCAGALYIESGACIDLSGRGVLDLSGSALCLSGE